jgi:hypothetical protein
MVEELKFKSFLAIPKNFILNPNLGRQDGQKIHLFKYFQQKRIFLFFISDNLGATQDCLF